eukprot:TRINITY_DN31949_c0_g1_i1.p1 TRINITY_DN31949_c0_g1~~TRINITY_DN31949_c0_g1_i1.p1  ORF type:complete len:314 (+),score=32.63 TRINITY_DN31949_c0_g1_i1:38-943(+)
MAGSPRLSLKGDSSQRVKVAVPRSFGELQTLARSHFGEPGKVVSLYHKGNGPLTGPTQIPNLKSGDVVVVSIPESAREKLPRTTQQAHYVAHRPEPRSPVVRNAAVKENLPFDGKTSYAQDYVQHPLQPNTPAQRPKAAWAPATNPEEKTGKSSYAVQYPWHNPVRERPDKKRYQGLHTTGAAFEGRSSYNMDYVKHPCARPRSAGAGGTRQAHTQITGPFEGTTTYANDFKKFEVATARSAKPSSNNLKLESAPFQGGTEYSREYMAKAQEGPLYVLLEPELKQPRRHQTPCSGRRPTDR